MNLKVVSFVGIFILIIVMGLATCLENSLGTVLTQKIFYHSWWFVLLWGLVALSASVCILRLRLRKSLVCLHASFILILLGALLTFLTSHKGVIHLRQGSENNTYYEETSQGKVASRLPFTLSLDRFSIRYYEGSELPSDYVSFFTIHDPDAEAPVCAMVSMNRIFSYRGIRFYQSSYDSDQKGSSLSVNEDRFGIPVTYSGYFLLFLSLFWMFVDKQGSFRSLLRKSRLYKLSVFCFLAFSSPLSMKAAPTFQEDMARDFGKTLVSYHGRVCPVQTLAIDLVRKLHGSDHYRGYSAEQVLGGFLFYAVEWDREPVVRVKDRGLRNALRCDKYVSVNQLVNDGHYILQSYIESYYQGKKTSVNKAAIELDERLQLLALLRQGSILRVFPVKQSDGQVRWYSPVDSLPDELPNTQRIFVREAFGWLYEYGVRKGDDTLVREILSKIKSYQQQYGGSSVPDSFRLRAEYLYNAFPMVPFLYKVNLAIGMASFLVLIVVLLKNQPLPYVSNPWIKGGGWFLLGSVFLLLTFHIALRGLICGRLPMGNGYETMLLLAWLVLLLGVFLYRFFPALISFSFLLSGFFLLVSGISQMDPVMTHLVPVLSSPLLSIHVSLVMSAYALLAFTALCAIVSLLLLVFRRLSVYEVVKRQKSLLFLSHLFLYPGVFLLASGIFVGAIWANVSWGRYWGWDPKEVWALINLLLYAVPLHRFRFFRSPVRYHLYLLFCFLTVLMTYIGVNYFLGGMHSYA